MKNFGNEYYEYYNANPHGKKTGDCVIRALAVVLGKSWETVYRDLVDIGLTYGYMINDPKCYERYLKSLGWEKYDEPRDYRNKKVQVCQFMQSIDNDVIFARVGSRHVTAIKNHKVIDIWDCSREKMHTYWRKK